MKDYVKVFHIVADAKNAATIYLEVDPNDLVVSASWSVCRGDTFCKKTGIEIAKNREEVLIFNIKEDTNLLDRFFKALCFEIGSALGTANPYTAFLKPSGWTPKIQVEFLHDKLQVMKRIYDPSKAY